MDSGHHDLQTPSQGINQRNLKIWQWELIFGCAVMSISSLGVRSPWWTPQPWLVIWFVCLFVCLNPYIFVIWIDEIYFFRFAQWTPKPWLVPGPRRPVEKAWLTSSVQSWEQTVAVMPSQPQFVLSSVPGISITPFWQTCKTLAQIMVLGSTKTWVDFKDAGVRFDIETLLFDLFVCLFVCLFKSWSALLPHDSNPNFFVIWIDVIYIFSGLLSGHQNHDLCRGPAGLSKRHDWHPRYRAEDKLWLWRHCCRL